VLLGLRIVLPLALIAAACHRGEGQKPPPAPAPPPAPVVPIPGAPASFVDLVKRARPSVVNIHTTAIIRQEPVAVLPFGEFSPFYEIVRPPDKRAQSLGSGIVISPDGEVLTNNHVIAPEELRGRAADVIIVKLDDKREFRARVLFRDPATDLALLKIDAAGLQAASLGDSDTLEVGEWVVAIGQPYGLTSTVTAGIVSAKGRHGDDIGRGLNQGYWDFIQTDCAINPGNSGGPLYDMRGRLVGVNTAIRAQAQGLAFAVPVNMVKRVLSDWKRHGRVMRGWLGMRALDPRELGLRLEQGVIVGAVARGGPLDRAGIGRGDLILELDGVPVENQERLRWLEANAGVGKQVSLRVQRGERVFDVKVTTIAQPE
jgi:serine protease Do